MPTIAGIVMSKAKAEAFVNEVFEVAEARGYCEESVTDVLEGLGFDVVTGEVEVVVRFRVADVRRGFNINEVDASAIDISLYGSGFGDDAYMESIENITLA